MLNEKKRGGSDPVTDHTPAPVVAPKKWWQSTGFFTSAILFAAGAWGLNSADFDATIKSAVLQIYAFVGTAGVVRAFVVNAKLNLKAWLGQLRTYEYLIAALTGIIPNLPADAGSYLFDLVNAIKTGNIGIIISQAVTFLVFAWNVWKSQQGKVPAVKE